MRCVAGLQVACVLHFLCILAANHAADTTANLSAGTSAAASEPDMAMNLPVPSAGVLKTVESTLPGTSAFPLSVASYLAGPHASASVAASIADPAAIAAQQSATPSMSMSMSASDQQLSSPLMIQLQETVNRFHQQRDREAAQRHSHFASSHRSSADRQAEREWERRVDQALAREQRRRHHSDDDGDEEEFMAARYRFRDMDRDQSSVSAGHRHQQQATEPRQNNQRNANTPSQQQTSKRQSRETSALDRNTHTSLIESYADAGTKGEDGVFGWCKTCVFVLERIKKGTNMLLPAICSEIYISFPNAYALCHQVLNALSLNGNNVRYWLFEGCYKYEIYQAKEWVKPCPSHVMCTVLKNLQNKSFCKPLPMEDPFKDDTDEIA